MAYYRRRRGGYGRRRMRRRRAPKSSGWGGYLSTAGRALSLATRVASLINVEYKNIDVTGSGNMAATWTVVPISEVAQGDDQTNRNGRSILAKSINLQVGMTAASLASSSYRTRLAIFVDDMQQGVAPVGTDVWTANGMEALRNVVTKQRRFRILFDRCYTINPDDGGNSAISVRRFIKLYKHHIKYIGTTAAAASDGFGSLYFAYITDASATFPVINYAVRTRFIDN